MTEVLDLDVYRKQGANVLSPVSKITERISPFYVVKLTAVKIDPNPGNGEVYPVGRKEVSKGVWKDTFALHKNALEKLGLAMGVEWIEVRRVDDRSDRNYVAYIAKGRYRGFDGTWKYIVGDGELDLVAIEEEVRAEQEEKVASPKFKESSKYKEHAHIFKDMTPAEIIEWLVRREMLQWRKNKEARAATRAKLRALRSLGIKSSYTREELERPFIVVRTEFQPDESDPEIKEMVRKGIAYQAAALYGGRPSEYFGEEAEDAEFLESAGILEEARHGEPEKPSEEPEGGPKQEPEPETEPEPQTDEGFEELREVVRTADELIGPFETARIMLAYSGTDKIKDVPPEKRQVVIKALESATHAALDEQAAREGG